MSVSSRFQLFWLTHFSKPACDRLLYKLIAEKHCRNIVEIGLGDGQRTERMLNTALQYCAADEIRYTGIDRFEAGGAAQLSLKAAHKLLRSMNIRGTLTPGEPRDALKRVASAGLVDVDLIILSGAYEPQSLGLTWWYVPRMLSPEATVLVQSPEPHGTFRALAQMEIAKFAKATPKRRAA